MCPAKCSETGSAKIKVCVNYIPDSVIEYIRENQIYSLAEKKDDLPMAEYDFIKMQKKLAKYLDEDRYEHTLGVMFTCAALAMVHDCDLITAQDCRTAP